MSGRVGGDRAQICTLGLHFFHLDFNSLGHKEAKRTMELNGHQPLTLSPLPTHPSIQSLTSLLLTGLPEKFHMSVFLARVFLRVRTGKEKCHERWATEGKSTEKGRRRWKEKKGREGWAVRPRLCSADC